MEDFKDEVEKVMKNNDKLGEISIHGSIERVGEAFKMMCAHIRDKPVVLTFCVSTDEWGVDVDVTILYRNIE